MNTCNHATDHYCKDCVGSWKPNTTSTLNGKWPTDTWFQRARARALKQQAEQIEACNELSKV